MQYRILKDFKGSQDGRLTEQFIQGSTRELSDSLATVAVKEGWAAPATQEAPPPNPPVSSRKPRAASAVH